MPLTLEQIRQQNRDAVIAAMSQLSVINFDTVSTLLPELLAQEQLTLDHSAYTAADATTVEARGIGRYLVYDHEDDTNPFSIWVFALAPQQKTCIHDHSFSGTVTVLNGPMSEKYYLPTGENTARRIGRADRFRFHSNRDTLTDGFVHQLKNRQDPNAEPVTPAKTCVTFHIYQMPAHKISDSGIVSDNRNLNTIYTKDKSIDDEGHGPYKGPYQQLRM